MNKNIFVFIFALLPLLMFSQELAVQGIARDSNGTVRTNESLALSFEVYYLNTSNNPSAIFTDTKTLNTDNFGVFSTTIDLTADKESEITNREAYLKISAGNVIISNEKLKSVPYAISARNGIPTGSILPYMGATIPLGWLLCDGSAIPITTTTFALRDLLGSANTPNLQGMFLRGTGINSVNGQSGPELGTTQDEAIKEHDHGSGTLMADTAGEHTHETGFKLDKVSGGGINVLDGFGSDRDVLRETDPAGNHTHDISGHTASTGGAETRPVNYGINYIIKL